MPLERDNRSFSSPGTKADAPCVPARRSVITAWLSDNRVPVPKGLGQRPELGRCHQLLQKASEQEVWLGTASPLPPAEAGSEIFPPQHQIPELGKSWSNSCSANASLGRSAAAGHGEWSCHVRTPLFLEAQPQIPEINGSREPRGEIPRL